jgi:hypothetical protein
MSLAILLNDSESGGGAGASETTETIAYGAGQHMIRNTAGQRIGAQMESTTGGAFVGAVTVYVTKGNGAQTIGSVGGGAATHKGNGYHQYSPAQAETDNDYLAFTFVGSGARTQTVQVFTLPDTEIADAILGRDMASVAGAASRSLLNAIRVLRNKWSISGNVLTVTQENDSTTAWTATVGASAAADPITSVDPS